MNEIARAGLRDVARHVVGAKGNVWTRPKAWVVCGPPIHLRGGRKRRVRV